jgi:hypothetical protein
MFREFQPAARAITIFGAGGSRFVWRVFLTFKRSQPFEMRRSGEYFCSVKSFLRTALAEVLELRIFFCEMTRKILTLIRKSHNLE